MPRKVEPVPVLETPSSTGRLLIVTHCLPWVVNVKNYIPTSTPSLYSSLPRSVAKKLNIRNELYADSCSPLAKTKSEPSFELGMRRGHSALFSGIRSLSSGHSQVIHIGGAGPLNLEDSSTLEATSLSLDLREKLSLQLLEEKNCVPVYYNEKLRVGHYDGYCKSDLWPIFHYQLWDHTKTGQSESQNWNFYVSVNQLFTDRILQVYQPGDTIWIHDYHLLLVPSLVRKRIPLATIGFFLHTPFPSSELFRCLPKRKEILSGVLGSNLIGFQTYAYARHFISTCTRVLGCESSPKGVDFHGNQVVIGIFPIGIDVERAMEKKKAPAVLDKMNAIKSMYSGKFIIFGRDKLDHVKGIQHKLAAFEKFLIMYPEFVNKVVFLQVTTPSLKDSPKLESKVSELVSRINGNFGSLEFVPVHHYHQHLDLDDYFALLCAADIGLITSTRDGMNTTSHEYVICQQDNHGSLILSEFTGTAGSLSAAILVNPWDYVGVANSIYEALTMSKEEKMSKHAALYQHVTSHTSDFWASSFVKQLLSTEMIQQKSNPTPYLDTNVLLARYNGTSKRLFLFDYDTPNAAVPTPKMLGALEILVNNPKNFVYVVSGRDQAFLDQHLGHIEGLGLSAEHGCFIKYPYTNKWINLSAEFDLTWKSEVAEIFNYFTERTQGSFVEHKRCSITWHYRLADPDYGLFQAKECQNHLENAIQSKLPVEVLLGKKNLEVRPIAINKGEVAKRILSFYPSDIDFVFCVGDDRTDEDMFKALKKSDLKEHVYFTCTIGSGTKKTHAQWHVSSPDDVIQLLCLLSEQS